MLTYILRQQSQLRNGESPKKRCVAPAVSFITRRPRAELIGLTGHGQQSY
jgi:hypothetical protein